MEKWSYLSNAHPEYIEELYQRYQSDPENVDAGWRKFFEGFELAQQWNGNGRAAGEGDAERRKEVNVLNLINAYRTRGHLFTKTNPVRERRKYTPTLEIQNFGLSESDLNSTFEAGVDIGIGPARLRDIIAHLQETYCHSIGAEYMFIRRPERIAWLKERMESTRNRPQFNLQEKRHILQRLSEAVVFENFLHTKYVGQKRFALSGGETLIPALDAIIEKGSQLGVKEFVIGMAHRGRLNVLANILRKSYQDIFSEFEGLAHETAVFEGDVKYHLGYSSNVTTAGGKEVHLSMVANPSHLEAVDPVVSGVVRAKLDKRYDNQLNRIVPIVIHGDAAVAAQGVVYEVIQMSLLDAYATGGSIHLVINNQIGFTTNYLDARSSTYSTDVAKVTQSPVFHVNGDDVEAVVLAIVMAMEYRQKFHTDVFIDILGYRKYGHNEADEPRFTQPKLYQAIAKHPDPRKIYEEQLVEEGSFSKGLAKEMENEFQDLLQHRLNKAREANQAAKISAFKADWTGYRRPIHKDFDLSPESGYDQDRLLAIGKKIFTIPESFKAYSKIRRLYQDRMEKFKSKKDLDWAIGEFLAYATLLDEGIPIRISGQDCERGTFSHRHSVLTSEDTENEYIPLDHVREGQARFQIYNSLLSEYAVLGFEYGYATANPKGLTIWEAQFGDFSNGAQIIIDQFISASETKWMRYNGLVLYLPHGYEGQGPEHSSARIERFLSLCAQDNMIAANCTTPANLFHILRRHMKYPFRIPMVIFTPKSLLRHPKCVSRLDDFCGDSRFMEVIPDDYVDTKKVSRVLVCSGKIYFDLLERQEADKRKDIAVVRMEQLYPTPSVQFRKVLDRYPKAKDHVWVQEEPENMGPWTFQQRMLADFNLKLICREASASPATGFNKQHHAEQKGLIGAAFGKTIEHQSKITV